MISSKILSQVVLPEGSKEPSAVVPFPVDQHLEVVIYNDTLYIGYLILLFGLSFFIGKK